VEHKKVRREGFPIQRFLSKRGCMISFVSFVPPSVYTQLTNVFYLWPNGHCLSIFHWRERKPRTYLPYQPEQACFVMSSENESGQERRAHVYGPSSSSSPSSTDAATYVHEEYPSNEEQRLPIGNKPQRLATPPWYQEHGEFNYTFSDNVLLWNPLAHYSRENRRSDRSRAG
jgi:hypothetical protein